MTENHLFLYFISNNEFSKGRRAIMKKFIRTILILTLFSGCLFSYEYIVDNNPTRTWSFSYHSGSTQITTLTGGNWDDGYYDLSLPASNQFYFYGKKVTHLRISTNGYIRLGFGSATGDGTDLGNDSIPNTTDPDAIAAIYWDDLDIRTQGSIWYTLGSSYTFVEWRDVPRYGDSSTSYDFTVTFHGSAHGNLPSEILFQYQDVGSGGSPYDYGASATVGVEHYMGTQGEEYSYNTASLSNGDIILFTPFVPIYGSTLDHADADSKPDIVVFRPNGGNWFFKNSDGTTFGPWHFGTRGDIALPGDYDGDGDADEVVYRPNNSHWFGNSPGFIKKWGQSSDIPVPADYNGDGLMDIATWRPSTGHWFIYYRTLGTSEVRHWGTEGDIPVPADYDNDGKADCAVYRPSNDYWFIRKSSNPSSSWVKQWGSEGDIPMPGNFNTSSYSTLSVFRPSNGYWFSYNQAIGGSLVVQWGTDGDQPVPCDENTGGLSNYVVFRPDIGKWFIKNAVTFPSVLNWGTLGDKPRYRRSFLIVSPGYDSGNDLR